MIPILADFWMHGNWPPNIAASIGGADLMKDVYGQAITVGSTVKLLCTVVALNPTDPHFQDVIVVPNMPQAAPFPLVNGNVFPGSGINQATPNPVLAFHPLQLVVGG